MTGDIAGTVFNDANANGVAESTENGLPGWTVFVDSNANSQQDSGEPFAVTDDNGKFVIAGLPTVATRIAVGESYTTNEDTVLSVVAPGVLANDTDIDSPLLSAAIVTQPLHGTVTLSSNGAFVYRPAANYNGPDSFTYRVNDGAANSNVATVALNVLAVNDAPVAVGDSYSTNRDVPLTLTAPGVLSNDSDVDGDAITAVVGTGPANGTLSLNANGSLTYTPNASFTGTDSFTYAARDAALQSTFTTVTITVLAPPPLGPKFFVVDGANKGTFKYAADGAYMSSHLLNKADSKPRGIASNPNGTIQWVIDGGGTVFVYNNVGDLLGSWVPTNVGKPEGITVWGNDLWLVDPTADRVHVFPGGANLRTGRVGSTGSFQLNAANLNATDIVTDGVHLWVLNDTPTSDRVF